jgi:N-hydroxyarylamine O-acetyltransferase
MSEELGTAGEPAGVDLDGYFHRVGYAGGRAATLETLRRLHFAHVTAIPFENLDVYFGRPMPLDLASLQAKLVVGRRGGYCFEHNTLFAGVLESLGFEVTRLAARVRMGAAGIRPRLHMLLLVHLQGEPHVADVGFGGAGLLYPIPLHAHGPIDQLGWTYRMQDEGPAHVLQLLRDGQWLDLYAFTLEPQFAIDYVVANHFTATYPDSPFVTTLVVQKSGPEARWSLRGRELVEERPAGKKQTLLADDEAVVRALKEVFGIHVPPGTQFRLRDQTHA